MKVMGIQFKNHVCSIKEEDFHIVVEGLDHLQEGLFFSDCHNPYGPAVVYFGQERKHNKSQYVLDGIPMSKETWEKEKQRWLFADEFNNLLCSPNKT